MRGANTITCFALCPSAISETSSIWESSSSNSSSSSMTLPSSVTYATNRCSLNVSFNVLNARKGMHTRFAHGWQAVLSTSWHTQRARSTFNSMWRGHLTANRRSICLRIFRKSTCQSMITPLRETPFSSWKSRGRRDKVGGDDQAKLHHQPHHLNLKTLISTKIPQAKITHLGNARVFRGLMLK